MKVPRPAIEQLRDAIKSLAHVARERAPGDVLRGISLADGWTRFKAEGASELELRAYADAHATANPRGEA